MVLAIKGQTKAAAAFKGNFGDYGLTPSWEKKGGRHKIEIGHQGALYFIIFENQGGSVPFWQNVEQNWEPDASSGGSEATVVAS